jgi:hypothetical protein
MIIFCLLYLFLISVLGTYTDCVNTTNYQIPGDLYGHILDPCDDGECWSYCDHTQWHNMTTGTAMLALNHLQSEQAECIETACTHFYYSRADLQILELCASVKCRVGPGAIRTSRECSQLIVEASIVYKDLEDQKKNFEDLSAKNRSIIEIIKNEFIVNVDGIVDEEHRMVWDFEQMVSDMTGVINVKDPETEMPMLNSIADALLKVQNVSFEISDHINGVIDDLTPILKRLTREERYTNYQKTITEGLMVTKEYMDTLRTEISFSMATKINKCTVLDTLVEDLGRYCYICSKHGTCSYNLETKSYQCACDLGVHGVFCELDMRVCKDEPCQNEGACRNEFDTFRCQCTNQWTGKFCHIPIENACADSPCQNGGTCQADDLVTGKYICKCPFGFFGKNCQYALESCSEVNPCQNGGKCVYDGYRVSCRCPVEPVYRQPFWIGDTCEEEQFQCNYDQNALDNGALLNDYPCYGHGICSLDRYETHWICNCNHDWRGPRCNINIKNTDVCVYNYNVLCEHGSCDHCTRPENCTCTCEAGWKGIQCHIDIDECDPNQCQNEAPCENLKNDYYCDCAKIPGHFGFKKCNKKASCLDMPCGLSERFISCNDNAKTISGIECACKPGFMGERCEIDARKCHDRVCLNDGSCVQGYPFAFCNCPEGFSGERCEKLPAFCETNPCGSNGKCLTLSDRYECQCYDGWDGPQCNHNIDDCKPNPCFHADRCVDKVHAFECVCEPGWHGHTCDHIDSPCDIVICYNHGVCIDTRNHHWTDSDYKCACVDGYYGPFCRRNQIPLWIWIGVPSLIIVIAAGIYLFAKSCSSTEIHIDQPRKKRQLLMM